MPPPTVSLGQAYQRVPGLRPSWRRRLFGVSLVLLLAGVVYVSGSVSGAHVLRLVRIQVHGRVVDATTGGARIQSLDGSRVFQEFLRGQVGVHAKRLRQIAKDASKLARLAGDVHTVP